MLQESCRPEQRRKELVRSEDTVPFGPWRIVIQDFLSASKALHPGETTRVLEQVPGIQMEPRRACKFLASLCRWKKWKGLIHIMRDSGTSS